MRLALQTFLLGAALLAAVLTSAAAAHAQPAECVLDPGFTALADAIASVERAEAVGACRGNTVATESGDVWQRTTGGIFIWHKADNLTAFTDGVRAWYWSLAGLERTARPADMPPQIEQVLGFLPGGSHLLLMSGSSGALTPRGDGHFTLEVDAPASQVVVVTSEPWQRVASVPLPQILPLWDVLSLGLDPLYAALVLPDAAPDTRLVLQLRQPVLDATGDRLTVEATEPADPTKIPTPLTDLANGPGNSLPVSFAAVQVVVYTPGAPETTEEIAAADEEATLLALVNDLRAQQGQSPLAPSQGLRAVANDIAAYLASPECQTRFCPPPNDLAARLSAVGPLPWVRARESTVRGPASPEDAFATFAGFPASRASFLDPTATHAGIGLAHTESDQPVWVALVAVLEESR